MASGDGVFSRRYAGFAKLLSDTALDRQLGNQRFVARNFLLDEGVPEGRAETYGQSGAAEGFEDFGAWKSGHEEYLHEQVMLDQPIDGPPRRLVPDDAADWPETFRADWDFPVFGAADIRLDLVRLVAAESIAMGAGVPESLVVALTGQAVSAGTANTDAAQRLEAVLHSWSSQLDLRPVYTAFWEDIRDLLGEKPEADADGWADALRDRLGLCHLDPAARGRPLPVILFRYPVSNVPRVKGVRSKRPLLPPTVLDGEFSEAFCPAPREEACGRVVDLSARLDTPTRELVHPQFRLQVKHVLRVGHIRQPVPRDLSDARMGHLMWLRDACGRTEYAAGTDWDFLS